jgi:starch-binding outer membrane protein, SusD/RagB family
MKRANFKIYLPLGFAVVGLVFSCSKSFLEKPPVGSYTPDVVASKAGVSGLLIGAYSMLDGKGGAGTNVPGGGDWVTAGSNWVYGGVCSDDAHKGSDPGDQPDIVSLMTWSESSTNNYLEGKWEACYDGVQRANEVLRVMRIATDISPVDTLEFSAEARFLRAHYMMELKKMFGNGRLTRNSGRGWTCKQIGCLGIPRQGLHVPAEIRCCASSADSAHGKR